MRIYTPIYIAVRVVAYSLIMVCIFLAIRFDARSPMEEGYFGEISLTEISQEFIMFTLFVFYLFFGYKNRTLQPMTNILSLFFLILFFRELNFFIAWWLYPVLIISVLIVWLVVRDHKKLKGVISVFFAHPASSWFFAGLLVTCVFSRLFGQSAFWRLLYDEGHYRLAKAAVEEGTELLGDSLMLIACIEFTITWLAQKMKGASR